MVSSVCRVFTHLICFYQAYQIGFEFLFRIGNGIDLVV